MNQQETTQEQNKEQPQSQLSEEFTTWLKQIEQEQDAINAKKILDTPSQKRIPGTASNKFMQQTVKIPAKGYKNYSGVWDPKAAREKFAVYALSYDTIKAIRYVSFNNTKMFYHRYANQLGCSIATFYKAMAREPLKLEVITAIENFVKRKGLVDLGGQHTSLDMNKKWHELFDLIDKMGDQLTVESLREVKRWVKENKIEVLTQSALYRMRGEISNSEMIDSNGNKLA